MNRKLLLGIIIFLAILIIFLIVLVVLANKNIKSEGDLLSYNSDLDIEYLDGNYLLKENNLLLFIPNYKSLKLDILNLDSF